MESKIIQKINNILKNNELSGYRANEKYLYGGKYIKNLEKEISNKFKCKNVIICNSATSGLWSALNILSLKKDSEIIVTPYSMTCSASLPLLFQSKPVFCDIEEDYFCIDPEKIERKINTKTKAIIAVDLFGMPYSEKINQIAEKYKIPIIEDAAQAIGATRNGKYAGTLGDIGILSFNQHKHINAGEGGAILTNNDEYAEKLRYSINHAEAISNETNKYIDLIGMNLRMTEITACIVLEQFKKLDTILNGYREHDFNIKLRENCISSFYKYAFIDRQDIDTEKYYFKQGYIIPIYKMPVFRNLGYMQNLCPVCEKIESKINIVWKK